MDQNISGILIELFVTIKYIVHLNMTAGLGDSFFFKIHYRY